MSKTKDYRYYAIPLKEQKYVCPTCGDKWGLYMETESNGSESYNIYLHCGTCKQEWILNWAVHRPRRNG